MKPIPYGRQDITDEDIQNVVKTLKSDFLTQGPRIKEFEEKFSNYIGSKYAVAVSNGTAALHISAMALGVGSNSNVITTPITFSASANCIRYCGGNVFFADIDPTNLCIDPEKIIELINSKPKGFFSGIIPVDFGGYPANLERLKLIANEHNLWILEDSCHAPGGYFINSKNEKSFCGDCRYSDLAIFSFHPVKHIACGEGGMVTTNSENLYNELLKLRSHGMVYQGNTELIENHGGWYMEMQELGYNYRLTEFQSALGISQLERAAEGLLKRKAIANKYSKAFEGNSSINIIQNPEGHAYHLYIIQVANRKEAYDFLKKRDIIVQVHYIPVHLMPYYKNLGFNKGDFPVSEKYYEGCLSIPMFPTLTEDEQDYVIESILNFANNEN